MRFNCLTDPENEFQRIGVDEKRFVVSIVIGDALNSCHIDWNTRNVSVSCAQVSNGLDEIFRLYWLDKKAYRHLQLNSIKWRIYSDILPFPIV